MCTQITDSIIYEGDYLVTTTELDIPDQHPQIISRDTSVIVNGQRVCIETSICWRGYIALWEIKNGNLFLNGFTDEDDVISKYEVTVNAPILADWISEEIMIPMGELLPSGNMCEKDLILKLVNGTVVSSRTIDNLFQQ